MQTLLELIVAKRDHLKCQLATMEQIVDLLGRDGLSNLPVASANDLSGDGATILRALSAAATAPPKTGRYKPGSRKMSPEARRKLSESQAARWAKKRKETKGPVKVTPKPATKLRKAA